MEFVLGDRTGSKDKNIALDKKKVGFYNITVYRQILRGCFLTVGGVKIDAIAVINLNVILSFEKKKLWPPDPTGSTLRAGTIHVWGYFFLNILTVQYIANILRICSILATPLSHFLLEWHLALSIEDYLPKSMITIIVQFIVFDFEILKYIFWQFNFFASAHAQGRVTIIIIIII